MTSDPRWTIPNSVTGTEVYGPNPWGKQAPIQYPDLGGLLGMQKIKLKFSELEKLRAAAKQNPEIKEILEKFIPLIEITPDFD